jgi:uncharacterized cupin superfamily protein
MFMAVIVRRATEEEKAYMLRETVWESGVSEFVWRYDKDETCMLTEGRAAVTFDGGSVSLAAGDIAYFPKGLDCVWKVHAAVKKHYR